MGSQPWTSGETTLEESCGMGYSPGMKRDLGELKIDLSSLAGIYIIINLHIKIAREEMFS